MSRCSGHRSLLGSYLLAHGGLILLTGGAAAALAPGAEAALYLIAAMVFGVPLVQLGARCRRRASAARRDGSPPELALEADGRQGEAARPIYF